MPESLSEISTDIPMNEARTIINEIIRSAGGGGSDIQTQLFMSRLNRFGRGAHAPNVERSGLTFITRPKLNLTNAQLIKSRILTPFMTMNPRSMAFAIRCLLDTKFARNNAGVAAHASFFDMNNPFLVPLCSGLTSFSGAPDPYLEVHTTAPGFRNEDQTIVAGGDNLNRTYDLTLTFQDIHTGPIAALFLVWYSYMQLQARGITNAYIEDINEQLLNYTISIYRFVLDPTMRYITRHARFVGCFPKSVPYGSMFAINEGEAYVQAISSFSIPFACNKVVYDDYASLHDFNALMRKYAPGIDTAFPMTHAASTNYIGLPYISSTPQGWELEFRDYNVTTPWGSDFPSL